ncbi:MAG: transglutaminase family protein [Hyphomicrobiaceae bacterium]|nr:transglutaminase family protein [Hyphomicrobiaceae bacterium]
MIYDLAHVTRYDYSAPVAESRCLLRLMPVDRPGQKVQAAKLAFEPEPARQVSRIDAFGNHIVEVEFDKPHKSLIIKATARTSIERSMFTVPAATRPWETVREAAREATDLSEAGPAIYLYESRHIAFDTRVTDYCAASFPPGRPILEGALELARRIQKDFAYDPKATEVSTPLARAFQVKRGVCQDFAHVMIAGLRGLGLCAGYVSGYLRTVPPPGKPRLEGADATHAWVSVWCGPEIGWVGVDPTNGILASDDHVILAIGRDYADIAPVDGVIIASGNHKLSVAVDVVPVARA